VRWCSRDYIEIFENASDTDTDGLSSSNSSMALASVLGSRLRLSALHFTGKRYELNGIVGLAQLYTTHQTDTPTSMWTYTIVLCAAAGLIHIHHLINC
jgi:hypothetical protein